MQVSRYIIYYDTGVLEKLVKFPRADQKRIVDAINKKLTLAPLEFGKPLRYEWGAHRRLRVDDYRVIYRVIEDKIIVFIVDIDLRRDIY